MKQAVYGFLFASAALLLSACEPEQIRNNDEIIRRQEDESGKLREEYEKQRAEWLKKREAEVKE